MFLVAPARIEGFKEHVYEAANCRDSIDAQADNAKVNAVIVGFTGGRKEGVVVEESVAEWAQVDCTLD